MNRKIAAVSLFLLVAALESFAQSHALARQPAGVTVLHRTTPGDPAGIPTPDKYPFAKLKDTLKQGDARPPLGAAPAGTSQMASISRATVPANFVEIPDVPLTPTATAAVSVSKAMVGDLNLPAAGPDGRVIYTYGVGMPTIVCAPLRLCSLELQPGEKIEGEPQIGDSLRWDVSPAQMGSDDGAVSVIVLKPKMAGLDTSLLITTDKRTYYVRLISKPEEFMARTAFVYADDEHVQWHLFLEQQEKERKQHLADTQIAQTSTAAIDHLYFAYTIKGDRNATEFTPDRVLDDGEKTYIQMPVSVEHRELPALVIVGPTGNEMVNYRVKGDTYIVDRLFDRAALLMGSGKNSHVVQIRRKQKLAGGEVK